MTDPYPTGPVVYILRNGKSLYVSATIDLSHRIRQHNSELSGGAHRTSIKGPGWVCLLYVQGFQSRTESLQFEYALTVVCFTTAPLHPPPVGVSSRLGVAPRPSCPTAFCAATTTQVHCTPKSPHPPFFSHRWPIPLDHVRIPLSLPGSNTRVSLPSCLHPLPGIPPALPCALPQVRLPLLP